jgi:hypothetical protein
MDGGWLVRLRWRRRGAWLWHTFVALTIVDAVIGHALPAAGGSASLVGAAIFALFANLVAVLLLSRPLAALIRRRRKDLPGIVAYDLGGRTGLVAVTVVFLGVGIAHHPSIDSQDHALQDAVARAEAYIGDRAPDEFVRDLNEMNSVVIQPGSVYRMCVPGRGDGRNYCVVVKRDLPFAQSVSFAGSESNAVFAQGVQ